MLDRVYRANVWYCINEGWFVSMATITIWSHWESKVDVSCIMLISVISFQQQVFSQFSQAKSHIPYREQRNSLFRKYTYDWVCYCAIIYNDVFPPISPEDNVLEQIRHSTNRELEPAQKIIERIRSRDLYKCVFERKLNPGVCINIFVSHIGLSRY